MKKIFLPTSLALLTACVPEELPNANAGNPLPEQFTLSADDLAMTAPDNGTLSGIWLISYNFTSSQVTDDISTPEPIDSVQEALDGSGYKQIVIFNEQQGQLLQRDCVSAPDDLVNSGGTLVEDGNTKSIDIPELPGELPTDSYSHTMTFTNNNHVNGELQFTFVDAVSEYEQNEVVNGHITGAIEGIKISNATDFETLSGQRLTINQFDDASITETKSYNVVCYEAFKVVMSVESGYSESLLVEASSTNYDVSVLARHQDGSLVSSSIRLTSDVDQKLYDNNTNVLQHHLTGNHFSIDATEYAQEANLPLDGLSYSTADYYYSYTNLEDSVANNDQIEPVNTDITISTDRVNGSYQGTDDSNLSLDIELDITF